MVSRSTWRVLNIVCTATLLAACAAAIEEARHEAEDKVPRAGLVELPLLWSLPGARLSSARDPLGQTRASAAAAHTLFVRPSSVAARGADLAVIDSGAGALYRVDAAAQLMVRLPVNVTPMARIEMLADRTLLVVDGVQRRVLRLAGDGRLLQEITAPAVDLGQPVAVVSDDRAARLLVADALYGQIVEFHPAGVASRPIPVRDDNGRVTSLIGLATGTRGWYLLDGGCRCVLIVDRDGRVIGREGVNELTQPVALAVDASGRVFVADAGARTLRVFAQGRTMQGFAYRELGVNEILDLRIDEATLYLATGLSGRIDVRRIVARGRARS